MARQHTKAVALALTIFVAGMVVGAASYRHWSYVDFEQGDPIARAHAELLERFRVSLDLTDDQVQQISDIMNRVRVEAEAIIANEQPAFRDLHERAHRDIREVLTDEQAIAYEKIIESYNLAHHPRIH